MLKLKLLAAAADTLAGISLRPHLLSYTRILQDL